MGILFKTKSLKYSTLKEVVSILDRDKYSEKPRGSEA
jgi:hypothetical protein